MPTLTPKPHGYSRKYRKKLRRKGKRSTTKYAALFIVVGVFMLSAGSTIFLFNSTRFDDDAGATITTWSEVTDPETGGVYYWNQATGETTWRRPRELESLRRPPPKPPAPKNGDDRVISSRSDSHRDSHQDSHQDESKKHNILSDPIHVPSIPKKPDPIHVDLPKLDETPPVPSKKPPPPSSKKCTAENVMTGMDLRGGDMPLPDGEVYNILSLESCCVACRENAQCVAWVYQSTSKVCYLKNRETTEVRGHVDLSAGRIPGRVPVCSLSLSLSLSHTHTHTAWQRTAQ